VASASGRSRSSRRVSPPGVAELPRPDSLRSYEQTSALGLADDAGPGAKALSSSPLILAPRVRREDIVKLTEALMRCFRRR
jgi:hypothetical protein